MLKFSGNILSPLFLILFPFSITVLPILHGMVIALILFLSGMLYFQGRGKLYQINPNERALYFSIIFLVAVVFFVTVLINADLHGLKEISKFFLLLLVIPLYFYFRAVVIEYKWFWYGLVVGAVISAVIGFYDVLFDVYKYGYEGRAKGATHPIIFGDIALLMGVMSMAGVGSFKARGNWQVAWPVFALCAGLLASILSQSRGGWVAIPVFVVLLMWSSRPYISRAKQILGVLTLAIILTLIYLIPYTGMQQKVQDTLDHVQAYDNSEISEDVRSTSIGSRFEMWQASLQIFWDNPVVGVGWGNYRQHAKVLVDKGIRNPSAAAWPHPHNQFLSSLVGGGILALVATILLFYIPAKIFFDVVRSQQRSDDVRMIAMAGFIMIVGFAIFNLSESFLERSRTVAFFGFYLAVCMAGIRDNQKTVS